MKKYDFITKKYLIKEYSKNEKSIIYIARNLKCNPVTVWRYLKKYKIKIRKQSEIEKHNRKLKRWKKYYERNKKSILEKNKKYRKNGKEKWKKYKRYYEKEKRRKNLNYKLRHYLACRIYSALKRNSKSLSTIKLLGCSIKFLKQHLENQFKKGMNWKNYGKWHIDHIKPCVRFDLSKVNEQKKCFNYTNLQPLWAEENIIKRDKI